MTDISQRIAKLTPEQRALLEKRMRGVAPSSASSQPIAVIGMGCRLPGGVEGVEQYWQLLRDGVDAISEVPADRWDNGALHDPDPDAPGRISTRWGGFVAGVDRFDAAYFGVSPREAERLDPQQRLLLEVAVEALEDAGIPFNRLAGSETGVFVGAHGHASDYLWLQYADPASIDAFTGTGTAHNLFAGRLSYVFDLHGPALVIDTACSSSLAAVHLAVQSLRSGESSMALAGGVNLVLGPHFSIAASRMHMLAPDGRCKAFDRRADGFVRGEGCGVVVLKRLADALADGDTVRAVIRGSAMNQDGHTNGITAPNGRAQRAVIERALRDAGIEGHAVGYVEAHGTGTALGDPIEVEALAATVGVGTGDGPCYLGSVKTNIGHLEGAAGIASLIKAILVLQHRQVPPNLHFTGLNPHISISGTRLAMPAAPVDWAATAGPRLAGVSSFGWSGTNTHLVIEEAPAPAPASRSCVAPAPWLLPVAARSRAALEALVQAYRERTADADAGQLQAICASAALRRTHHDHRVAAVACDGAGMAASLAAALAARPPRPHFERPRVVFVFPGQGSQWQGMGRSLLAGEPAFRVAIERCAVAIRAEAGWSLTESLQGSGGAADIGVLQPTLFAMQVALAALWRSWGIVPEAVVGHSMGEVAAAHVAGILDLESAVRIICRRSALLRRIAGRGAMALVELTIDEARAECAAQPDLVAVAVSNGPRSCVLSGESAAVAGIVARLGVRGVYCRPVKVDVASHSPQVDELRDELQRGLTSIAPRAGEVPLYSTVDAARRIGPELDASYWVRNLREPVRFHDAVQQLIADGFDAFVEISPHPVLLPSIDDAIADAAADAITVASTRRELDERGELLSGLAGLYQRAALPAWGALWPQPPAPVTLPAYPWQRERFWFESLARAVDTSWMARPLPSAAGEDPRGWLLTPQWQPAQKSPTNAAAERGAWLLMADHDGRAVSLAAALEAAGHQAWLVRPDERFAVAGQREFTIRAGERDDMQRLLQHVEQASLPLLGIVHLWNLNAPAGHEDATAIERFQLFGCASIVGVVQALVAQDRLRMPRLTIVTAGAHSPDGRPVAPAQAPAWGLGRVIAEEHPECWGGSIDLDPSESPASSAARLVGELLDPQPEDGVAFASGGARHVLRLQAPASGPTRPFSCVAEASYLITGGLGGVGLETARWLAERGARHLVLAGRSGMPARDLWDTPRSEAQRSQVAAIRRIEALGAAVYPVSLDVTDEAAVTRLLQGEPGAALPPVRGIVHSAGVTADCLIDRLDFASFGKVLHPKLRGSVALARASRGLKLDFFVLYSSLGSLLGQPGQASYAAANAFIDALAIDLRQRGVPALAVNWGAWKELGLAQTVGARRTIEELERRGLRGYTGRQGTEALGHVLESGMVNALVTPADWKRFIDVAARTRVPSMVRDLVRGEVVAQPPAVTKIRGELDAAAPPDRPALLVSHLRAQLAEVLRLPVSQIEPEAPMGTLGLESLTALEFRKRLETATGSRLSATIMWNYPTIVALAQYLLERLYGPTSAPAYTSALPSARQPSDATGDTASAQPAALGVAAMSDEDAIQALMDDSRNPG